MNLFQNINQTISKVTKQAKKTYDTTKLELKIKGYYKEENELYHRLGRMIYSELQSSIDNEDVTGICSSIDVIKSRIQNLEKQISAIKTKTDFSGESPKNPSSHISLDKKESDLTITRTSDGIKIIRLCPDCQTINTPKDKACMNCGHIFNH